MVLVFQFALVQDGGQFQLLSIRDTKKTQGLCDTLLC